MLARIEPVHSFVSHKLGKLLIIFRVSWNFNYWSSLLLYSLLIGKWAHSTSTWKAEYLIGTLKANVSGRWLRVNLWVWYHSHVVMMFHTTSHCCIGSYWTATCRLCIHWLLNKLCKHTRSWYYAMIILSVLLRYCLDLICDIITIILGMIGEMISSTSHSGRFKIRHVRCDTSMSTCQPLNWIVNNLTWQSIKVVSCRINTLSRLHWLSLSYVLLLRIWCLCR